MVTMKKQGKQAPGGNVPEVEMPLNQDNNPVDGDQFEEGKIMSTDAESEDAVGFDDQSQAQAPVDIQEQLEQALAQVEEFKDQALRSTAEMENVRRRSEAELRNARKFAVERFALELLGVKDSLDIAKTVELKGDNEVLLKTMFEGLELTFKQLEQVLEKFSVATIDPEPGEKFDPEWHQAMTTQESENVPANHIVSVIQKGYALHERLLRPAMVVVAAAKNSENS